MRDDDALNDRQNQSNQSGKNQLHSHLENLGTQSPQIGSASLKQHPLAGEEILVAGTVEGTVFIWSLFRTMDLIEILQNETVCLTIFFVHNNIS